MSDFLNKIPVSPITSFGNPSVPNGATFGTNFSILQTGGYMEVYSLSGLTYTIPPATTGIIEFSGNSIPLQFTKGSGSVFSPDVLTLNSDNISSGRRKLGMLAYVYETNKIYQFRIDNYETLWNNATGATGPGGPTVVISDFGTTVKNNSAAGVDFINAWTASTISGVNGYDDTNASWRVLSTGGSGGGTSITGGTFNHGTETLTLYNSTGGTITITGFTDVYVTGGTYSSGTTTFTNSTGGTFQVTGYTKQGDYVESVTGDGVDNTDPLNPVISQNAKVNVITVTLGDLGLLQFEDNETMLLLSQLYLNSLNQNISYDTLYQLEIVEGTGTTPTYSFISEWNVPNPGQTITLPYEVGGIYSGIIDWGDGTTSINSYVNRAHTYTNSGIYTITITGIINRFRFANLGNKLNINKINQWGNINLGNNGEYFWGCNNLVLTGVTDTLNLSGTTNLTRMFANCSSLSTINNLNNWDVSNVTNMSFMFVECYNFNQNIGNWNVGNVLTMENMFICTSPTGIFNNGGSTSINNWDVSKVTIMSRMFWGQTLFNQPIGSWNVKSVVSMDNMFRNATNFDQNIGNWNISGVTNFTLFMVNKTPSTFSTTNLNSIYNGWSTKNPKTGITINFGSAKYTSAGSAGKAILTGSTGSGGYGWTITDGGI